MECGCAVIGTHQPERRQRSRMDQMARLWRSRVNTNLHAFGTFEVLGSLLNSSAVIRQ